MRVLGAVEDARYFQHLEARVDALEEARRGAEELDRPELETLDQPRDLAELGRRVELGSDLAARLHLDLALVFLDELVQRVVRDHDRKFHHMFALRRRRRAAPKKSEGGERESECADPEAFNPHRNCLLDV